MGLGRRVVVVDLVLVVSRALAGALAQHVAALDVVLIGLKGLGLDGADAVAARAELGLVGRVRHALSQVVRVRRVRNGRDGHLGPVLGLAGAQRA